MTSTLVNSNFQYMNPINREPGMLISLATQICIVISKDVYEVVAAGTQNMSIGVELDDDHWIHPVFINSKGHWSAIFVELLYFK